MLRHLRAFALITLVEYMRTSHVQLNCETRSDSDLVFGRKDERPARAQFNSRKWPDFCVTTSTIIIISKVEVDSFNIFGLSMSIAKITRRCRWPRHQPMVWRSIRSFALGSTLSSLNLQVNWSPIQLLPATRLWASVYLLLRWVGTLLFGCRWFGMSGLAPQLLLLASPDLTILPDCSQSLPLGESDG